MNKLAQHSYNTIKSVLLEREKMLEVVNIQLINLVRAFDHKFNRFRNNVKRQLEFTQEEIDIVYKQLDNKACYYYLDLLQIKDVQGYLDQHREALSNQSEEESLANYAIYNDTNYNTSYDESINHITTILQDTAKDLQNKKQEIIKVWALEQYYEALLKVEDELNRSLAPPEEYTENLNHGKGLTSMQQALAILLMNRCCEVDQQPERKSIAAFISALTNTSEGEIGKKIKLILDGDFIGQLSVKQNLIDYHAIRPYFEALRNKKIINFIDLKIKELQKMTDN